MSMPSVEDLSSVSLQPYGQNLSQFQQLQQHTQAQQQHHGNNLHNLSGSGSIYSSSTPLQTTTMYQQGSGAFQTSSSPQQQPQLQNQTQMMMPSPQQQQQQSLPPPQIMMGQPMPSLGGIAPNSALSFNNSIYQQQQTKLSNNKTRTPINLDENCVKLINMSIEKERRSLEADYEKVRNMNLLDDRHCLDTLQAYSGVMKVHTKFFIHILLGCYKSKYSELFEKYQDLEAYLLFCTTFVINRSEGDLKRKCINNTTNAPHFKRKFDFININKNRMSGSSLKINSGVIGNKNFVGNSLPPSKKPKKSVGTNNTVLSSSSPPPLPSQSSSSSSSSSSSANGSIQKTYEDSKKWILKTHPFLSNDKYLKFMILFRLGDLVKFCVPSSFAVMVAQSSMTMVHQYKQGGARENSVVGFKLSFSVPIVGLIKTRVTANKNYNYNSVVGLEHVAEILRKSLNLVLDSDPFTLGSRLSVSLIELSAKDGSPVELKQGSSLLDTAKQFIFVLMESFNGCNTDSQILNMKGYSNYVFTINQDWIDVKEESMQEFGACSDVENEIANLNKYYIENGLDISDNECGNSEDEEEDKEEEDGEKRTKNAGLADTATAITLDARDGSSTTGVTAASSNMYEEDACLMPTV